MPMGAGGDVPAGTPGASGVALLEALPVAGESPERAQAKRIRFDAPAPRC